MNRIDRMRAALDAAFTPTFLQIDDDSHLHAGHAGARSGRGHYRVEIVSTRFAGLALLARHSAVYEALGELMTTEIHARSEEHTSELQSLMRISSAGFCMTQKTTYT